MAQQRDVVDAVVIGVGPWSVTGATTAHRHGETATASGARRRLVRVGGTPWTWAGLERHRPQRRLGHQSVQRGEEWAAWRLTATVAASAYWARHSSLPICNL